MIPRTFGAYTCTNIQPRRNPETRSDRLTQSAVRGRIETYNVYEGRHGDIAFRLFAGLYRLQKLHIVVEFISYNSMKLLTKMQSTITSF